jgi:transcriptional regulator with XRE-family HTH domain
MYREVARMKLSDYIKERRERLNLTQEQVAEHCQVSTAAISRYENGHTAMKDLTVFRVTQLCDILHIDPMLFFRFPKDGDMSDLEARELCRMFERASPEAQATIRGVLMMDAQHQGKKKA